MRILPISQNNYKPSFNANSRWIYDKNGLELYKTTTYYFRDDLEWESLIKYLCKKYEKVPKVNFINHICSNGLEPLSFLMSILTYVPEQIKKFTPILAKDINAENIRMAKEGICGASSDDFLRINRITQGRYKEFLNLKQADGMQELFVMSPKEILTKNVKFEQGDIFEDIEKMPGKNTFLSCRNFWFYFPLKQQEEIAARLGKQLDSGSSVLLGFLDVQNGMAGRYLEKYGFERCPIGNKFENIMYSKI